MPTYEYRCHFCHKVSDAFQRMSDAPLVKCPHCGKEGLERIVTGGAGVIYKGEGWYVTDYSKKSSGGKEPTRGKESAKKSEATSDASKTETAKTEMTSAETKSAASSSSKTSSGNKSSDE